MIYSKAYLSLFFIGFLKYIKVALVIKNPPANAGDIRDSGSVPGLGRSPGGGHGNPTPVILSTFYCVVITTMHMIKGNSSLIP